MTNTAKTIQSDKPQKPLYERLAVNPPIDVNDGLRRAASARSLVQDAERLRHSEEERRNRGLLRDYAKILFRSAADAAEPDDAAKLAESMRLLELKAETVERDLSDARTYLSVRRELDARIANANAQPTESELAAAVQEQREKMEPTIAELKDELTKREAALERRREVDHGIRTLRWSIGSRLGANPRLRWGLDNE